MKILDPTKGPRAVWERAMADWLGLPHDKVFAGSMEITDRRQTVVIAWKATEPTLPTLGRGLGSYRAHWVGDEDPTFSHQFELRHDQADGMPPEPTLADIVAGTVTEEWKP